MGQSADSRAFAFNRQWLTWSAASLMVFTSAALAGQWAYGLAFLDSLKWLAGIVLVFYIPGLLVVRMARLTFTAWVTRPAVALAIGLVVVPVIYRFLRQFHMPDAYGMGLAAILVTYWLILVVRRKADSQTVPVNGPVNCLADGLGVLVLLAFICVLLHYSHFSDIVLNPEGFLFRASDMTESVYHLGLVNALADSYPPPALYASGGPDFSFYHLDMHLQMEALVRYFTLDALKLVSFYMPLLYFVLISLLTFSFVREAGGRTLTAAVCGCLIFGADFSWIPAVLIDPRAGFAWTAYFPPTIWGMFTLNGFLPALIALFLCFFLLREYLQRGDVRTLALFAVLAYCSVGLKSTMGVHLAGAALATGMAMVAANEFRRQGWSLIIASSITLLAVFVDLTFFRTGVADSVVRLAPMNVLQDTLERMGIAGLDGVWYLPMAAVFLVCALGVRAFGWFYFERNIGRSGARNWVLVFLAIFFVSGYFIAEMTFIGTNPDFNNSSWFYSQSLMLAWLPLFLWLVGLEQRPRAYYAALVATVLLAAPTLVQFLHLRNDPDYVKFGRDELAVVDFLRHTDPESVVLHPVNHGMPSLASNFAGRPSVLNVWVSFVTESDGLSERVMAVEHFFSGMASDEERLRILRQYDVRYVYGLRSELSFMDELPGVERVVQSGDLALYGVAQSGTPANN